MAFIRYILISLIIPLFVVTGTAGVGDDTSKYLVMLSPSKCNHGLFAQPDGGPFSVFIFCDDAAGVNIGIILTERGAGPGSINLTGTKVWDSWDTNDRFWQNKDWATDVVTFLWSPSLRYAYVATSRVYGDGGLFQLNLIDRTFKRIVPDSSANYFKQLNSGYSTSIKSIDLENNKATIEIFTFDDEDKPFAIEEISLK